MRARFPVYMQEALPEDIYWEHSEAAFPLYRMVGVCLDYEKLLRLGLPGLREEVREKGLLAKEDVYKRQDIVRVVKGRKVQPGVAGIQPAFGRQGAQVFGKAPPAIPTETAAVAQRGRCV